MLLNDVNTGMIMVESTHHTELFGVISTVIDDKTISVADHTRTSGVQMDHRLPMTPPKRPGHSDLGNTLSQQEITMLYTVLPVTAEP